MKLDIVSEDGLPLSELPSSWKELAQNPEREGLVRIARRFAEHGIKSGDIKERMEMLDLTGQELLMPFDATPYRAIAADHRVTLKHNLLNAIDLMSRELGGFVPGFVWKVLAIIAVRKDPTEMKSLVAEASQFPMGIVIADAVLHGLSETKALDGHVQTRLAQSANAVYMHCKDCNCSYRELDESESYRLPLKPGALKEQAEALLANILGATIRLKNGIPWEFTLPTGATR